MVQISYCFEDYYVENDRNTNIYIAVFTISTARLRLYKMLDYLGDNVAYFDTESIVYIDDGTKEAVVQFNSTISINVNFIKDEFFYKIVVMFNKMFNKIEFFVTKKRSIYIILKICVCVCVTAYRLGSWTS
jgi:hypothetical protein